MVEIIAGKASIEPETALQFERVLGMGADVWLNMEAAYRLHLAEVDESVRLSHEAVWASRFPVAELCKLGLLKAPKQAGDDVRQLLAFFGVGSVDACRERFGELAAVSYRHSPSFKSAEEPLLVWLRLGEIKADEIECADFDRSRFLEALRGVGQLTTKAIQEFLREIVKLCVSAGVAFTIIKLVCIRPDHTGAMTRRPLEVYVIALQARAAAAVPRKAAICGAPLLRTFTPRIPFALRRRNG